MLEKSLGMFFFLKQPKNKSNELERYIYLKITVNGISKEVSTKRQWPADKWNSKTNRATGTKEDARALNAHLDTITTKVYLIETLLLQKGKEITAQAIKDHLQGNNEDQKSVLVEFRSHNLMMKTLVGADYSEGTLERFETSFLHTQRFIKFKYGKDDLLLEELNYEFISDYFFWLKTERKCAQNTAIKYIGNFKKIILECVKKGYLVKDPFFGFKPKPKTIQKIALNFQEVQAIVKKKFMSDRLDLVRDIFIFSCYTGLAYCDVRKLTSDNIESPSPGEFWIVLKRTKTDNPVRVPLLPMPMAIIEKYATHTRISDSKRILPVPTNQKVNEYLKEIGTLCKITKNITFHIARHTFATALTMSNGVPIETISSMLGHSNIKQTQHYAKIVDFKVRSDMKRIAKQVNI